MGQSSSISKLIKENRTPGVPPATTPTPDCTVPPPSPAHSLLLLINTGTDCYVNALLQFLIATPILCLFLSSASKGGSTVRGAGNDGGRDCSADSEQRPHGLSAHRPALDGDSTESTPLPFKTEGPLDRGGSLNDVGSVLADGTPLSSLAWHGGPFFTVPKGIVAVDRERCKATADTTSGDRPTSPTPPVTPASDDATALLRALVKVVGPGTRALDKPTREPSMSTVHRLVQSLMRAPPFSQQDVHEALLVLLDALDVATRLPDAPTVSRVDELCQGMLAADIVCGACGATSRSTEPFVVLSLDATEAGVPGSLARYLAPEQLSSDNAFQCDSCSRTVDAVRHVRLHRLPCTLMVHLKRFSFNADGSASKVRSCSPAPHHWRVADDAGLHEYRLAAVVVHAGRSLHSGHYVTYAAVDGVNWVRFDDTEATLVPASAVRNACGSPFSRADTATAKRTATASATSVASALHDRAELTVARTLAGLDIPDETGYLLAYVRTNVQQQ